ncbi:nucleoside triphosphate pyrophosphohydrolase, partial [Corallococcus exercitus]
TLEAPSPAAVGRLLELFRAHHPERLVAGSSSAAGFQFLDPAGLRWEYAAPPA